MPPTDVRVVRLTDLATTDVLSVEEKVAALADAMRWFAVAQALAMFHGKERVAQRLDELGCPIRFNDDGEPVVVIHAAG